MTKILKFQVKFPGKSMVLAIFALFAGIASLSAGGLNGTYTIDKTKPASASNYISFNDADSDLTYGSRASGGTANGAGVSGPVVFNVADGIYYEQLTVVPKTGASATNTITYQSASKDSSKVILTDTITGGSSGTPGYTLHLDNVSFMHFNQITFKQGPDIAGSYDYVVIVDDQSDSDVFSNCQIIGNQLSGQSFLCVLLFSGGSTDQYNTFYNNLFKDAYDGIFWIGSSGGEELDNVFDHNTVDSITVYLGVALQYQDHLTFTNNKIHMINGYFSLYMFEINASTVNAPASLIANNFMANGTDVTYGVNYGIYGYGINKANVVYNNVNIYGSASSASYAAYIYPSVSTGTLNVYNNNFINLNSGTNDFGIYGNYFAAEDYNNIKTGGSSFGNYNGTTYASLAKWKTGTGKGKNDSTIDPLYNSVSDLHVNNASLNGVAKPLAYVTTDIDNETRNATTPDIGADEFTPVNVKPIVVSFTSPQAGFCVGTQDVSVTLKNFGLDTLTTVRISWKVNGVAQTSYLWTGSLAPYKSTSIKIGTYNFSSSTLTYTISAYPDSANAVTILSTATNTASASVRAGLPSGTYLVDNSGKGTPDYTSLRAAVSDLNNKGACGAITFTIADGNYNEQLTINAIPGSSSSNTVTFISKSKDSSKVIIDTAALGVTTYGYTVGLFGSRYITFRDVTIIDSASSNANGVEIGNGVNHATFENNVITVSTSTSAANFAVYNFNTIDNYITLQNNHITGGEVGIYFTGSGSFERGNVIEKNLVDSSWQYGILAQYQDSFTISKNNINVPNATYGIYLYNYNNTTPNKDTSYISNNFITSAGYGIYVYYPSKINIYDNSVTNSSGNPTLSVYGNTTGNSLNVLGNILSNTGGGEAIYVGNTGYFNNSNYNDLFTSGSIGYYNGTTCATLANWRTSSGKDKNSISADPLFKSPSTGDLHLGSASTAVLKKGISLYGITDDIDGQLRSSTPNIGADETKQISVDAALIGLDSPSVGFCSGTKDVYANLLNAGIDTLKSVTINWSVNGVTMTAVSWTGTLASLTSTSVKLGSITFAAGSTKFVKAWTSSPNGGVDSNALNDTFSKSVGTGISGSKTIGGVSPDYASFHAAVNALNNYGICGPVTFNVRDGSYNESVNIKAISGASASNKVIFQSQSLDSNKVVLDTSWAGSYASRAYTIKLDGASYVTFRKMTISNYTAKMYSYGDIVQLTNSASYNTFESNLMYTDVGVSANFGYGFYNNPGTAESHNSISNNVISGGEYGIYLVGTSAKGGTEFSNTIFNNFLDSSFGAGIFADYQDSLAIYGNQVFMTDGSYALYITDGQKGNTSNVVNNFFTIQSTGGYGIYCYNNLAVNFYNNSVNSSSSSNPSAYFNSGSVCKITSENNIFNNDGGGYAIYAYAMGLATSNYNDLYSSGDIGYWGTTGATCTALSDWKKASKKDANSVSGDPLYNSAITGDLHITYASTVVRKMGLSIASVKYDIDGQTRSLTTPDIGADELAIDSNDISASAIISPNKTGDCGNANTIVAVQITNTGLNDQTAFNVHVSVNATTTATIAFKGTLRGALSAAPHDTTLYAVFSPKLNTTAGGSYDIVAYTVLSTDKIPSNDTVKSTVTLGALPTANFTVANFGACAGSSLSVTDKSSGSSSWKYVLIDSKGNHVDSSTSQNPSLTSSTAGTYHILQTAYNGSCQDTVSKTVQIWSNPSAKIGMGIACLGAVTKFKDSSTAGSGAINSYAWDFGNKTTGNTSSPTTTYSIAGTFTVTLKVKDANGCSDSTSRSVVITAIDASFKDSVISNDGTSSFSANDKNYGSSGYSWNFGDLTAKGSGDSTTHKYTANNSYTVSLTVTDSKGCTATSSNVLVVLITGIMTDSKENFNLNIYPNPFKDQTAIEYTLTQSNRVVISIYSTDGRLISTLVSSNQDAGKHQVQLTGNDMLSQGIYIMKMTIGDQLMTRQIVKIR